ncbi:MAG: alpha/beta fold hydrolase [Patescibacteria group bacterium]
MKKNGLRLKDFLNISFAKQPSFSNDGKKVSYISNKSGAAQIYTIDRADKTIRQITSGNEPVTFASFSPASSKIAYGRSFGGNENTQLYLINSDGRSEKKISPCNAAQYRFGSWSPDGSRIAYTSNERDGTNFDAYVYDTKNGKRQCVHKGKGVWEAMHFSPVGSKLLLRKVVAPRVHELYLVDLFSGTAKHLFGKHLNSYYVPVGWRLGGDEILLLTNQSFEYLRLVFYSIQNRRSKVVIEDACDIERAALSPDEKCLAVVFNRNGESVLDIYNLVTKKKNAGSIAPSSVIGTMQWSPDSRLLAFAAENATTPSMIWTYHSKSASLKHLTRGEKKIPVGYRVKPVLKKYRSFDGLLVPLYCFYPKRTLKKNRKIFSLVFLHGGPDEQYRQTFSPLIQYLAFRGIAVFVPNIRGSSGYGRKYLALDDGEKKIDALRDVAELAHFIKRQKIFSVPALMGVSYGGYAVLAQLAFYPNLWAGGISSSGISNFLTYLKNTARWRRTLREKEYGDLKKDRGFLQSISPVTFANRIKSPVLLIHGKNDQRVPCSETVQIAEILRRQKIWVKTVLCKDEGHRIRKRANLFRASREIVEFLMSLFSSAGKEAKILKRKIRD